MSQQICTSLTLTVSVVLSTVLSSGGPLVSGDKDWPQWRGPERTGASSETGLLKSWPDGGPKLVWLFREAGIGYSSFAVVGDRLYTMGGRDGTDSIVAVDVMNGSQVWATEVGGLLKNNWGDGPRATPTVDGDHIYAMGGLGNLHCLKASDGSVVWEKSMGDLGGAVPSWGYTESVLVDGDRVVCTPGGDKGAIAALDKKTGEVLWQSKEFTDGAQYSSMIALDNHGVRQYVQLTMKNVVGISREDGKVLWRSGFPGHIAVAATPIFKDNRVYVTAGYGSGCKLIEIDAKQKAKDLYDNKKMKNHHGGVIRVGEHVYGYSDNVGWICQDLNSGDLVWKEKEQLQKGTLSYADGRFYCITEKSGDVALLEASPKGYKEHGRFKLEPKTKLRSPSGGIWVQPVIANGRLYLRDQELLFCYDVRGK